MSIYDFTVIDADENEVSLKDYEGKVILINNSATKCGFTPQYDDLQNMYEIFGPRGFVILDFPCNQFGSQTSDDINDIISFCDSTYGITFPIFEKIKVNGPDAAPLYKYLKSQKGFTGFDPEHIITPMLEAFLSRIDPDYKNNSEIKWNFTKFLIDRKGNVIERYEPTADLMEIEHKVDELLNE